MGVDKSGSSAKKCAGENEINKNAGGISGILEVLIPIRHDDTNRFSQLD